MEMHHQTKNRIVFAMLRDQQGKVREIHRCLFQQALCRRKRNRWHQG
jgi:hypothetical protein